MNIRQPPRIDEMWHATTDPVRPVDFVIALGLAGLSLVAFVGGAPDVGPPGVLTATLLLLESLPLIVRRRYPLEVFLIVVSATIVHIAALPEGQQLSAGLGVLVALYTVGERLDRRASLPLTVLAGAIVGVLLIVRGGFPAALQSIIQTELILGVAWLVGDTARVRRLFTRALEEQTRLLEREREERARRAVLEERERIARELHDVVAHHVSVIVIQSGGALRAIDTRPADARSALEAIAMTGRQALTDMRRLVGVPGEGEETAPLPRLEQLDSLLEEVRSAGLAVELTVEGDRRWLDPGLELSAYRIIQEGLTNSLKHAGGGRTTATVRYGADALEITIEDERGPGSPPALEPAHEGRGLMGMRERVAMFRGTFDAQRTSTGFRVAARLPTDERTLSS
ncbi:MAG TPA: histidine kinase [Candidatus Limnocylindrales bacterium]|nr:histidine kinase [Candidatus Limnocylindrales bacterium]